jgi:hypothetical protein
MTASTRNGRVRGICRTVGGEHEPVSSETAISEVAVRLRTIVDEHGPASVALYNGTYALAPAASMLSGAFMNAAGSPRKQENIR